MKNKTVFIVFIIGLGILIFALFGVSQKSEKLQGKLPSSISQKTVDQGDYPSLDVPESTGEPGDEQTDESSETTDQSVEEETNDAGDETCSSDSTNFPGCCQQPDGQCSQDCYAYNPDIDADCNKCTDSDDNPDDYPNPLIEGGKIHYKDALDGQEYDAWDTCDPDSQSSIFENTCDRDNQSPNDLVEFLPTNESITHAYSYKTACPSGSICYDKDVNGKPIPAYCDKQDARYICQESDSGYNIFTNGVVYVFDAVRGETVKEEKEYCKKDLTTGKYKYVSEVWCLSKKSNSPDLVERKTVPCPKGCDNSRGECYGYE